jgi:hypothetical protein
MDAPAATATDVMKSLRENLENEGMKFLLG